MEKEPENSLNQHNLILNDELIDNYSYVILKKQMKEFGSVVILNEFSQVIGKIKTKIFTINRRLEISDVQGNEIIRIKTENNFLSKNQLLKDKSDKIIGKIKKKRFFSSASKVYLKDKNGNKRYITVGDFKNWNYKIYNISDNKLVAKVKIFNEKDLLAQNLHINLKNHYYIEFATSNIEKFVIISFVISINDIISKVHRLSDITGFVRRIAQLRPIGPGKSFN